jgi:aminoglycoside 6'-N-acetyltransferase
MVERVRAILKRGFAKDNNIFGIPATLINCATVKDIRFKQLEKSDLPLVAGWLQTPHVARWWTSPADELAIAAKYTARMHHDSAVSVHVISVDGEPVGMIQAERLEEPRQAGGYGIDLLIGRFELTGQGLGPAIIEAFLDEYIFGRHAASFCIGDPALANTRSIRAFEKAGFLPIKTFSGNGEMHILMERRSSK